MTALDEARISALEEEVFTLRQRVFTLEMGPFATKAQLYRQVGRRFVDQLIADRKLIPEEVPGHKRPMFCTATFYMYADRMMRIKKYGKTEKRRRS